MKKPAILVLFITLLTVGAVIPAFARILFQPVDISDVNIAVKWAAVDEYHVAVDYDIEGEINFPEGYLPACPIGATRIFDATGNEIVAEVYTSCRPVNQQKYSVTQFYYGDFRANPPKRLDVTLGNVEVMPAGDGDVSVMPLIGTYRLDIQLEDISDITTSPKEKVKNGDISALVRKVEFTPSLVKVEACVTYPDKGDWSSSAYVVMGGQKIPVDEWLMLNYKDPKTFESRERCYTYITYTGVQDFRYMEAGAISFVIDEVYTNMPDCVDAKKLEKIQMKLEKYGFQPKLDWAGDYCFMGEIVHSKLTENDKAALLYDIEQTLAKHVSNPLEVKIR